MIPLRAALLRWADWRARHPHRTVLSPDVARRKRYDSEPYATYFDAGRLRYPVDPLPPRDGPAYMTPIVAVWDAAGWRAFTYEAVARSVQRGNADLSGVWGSGDRWAYHPEPPTAWLDVSAGDSAPVVYACWFAWYAHHSFETDLAP